MILSSILTHRLLAQLLASAKFPKMCFADAAQQVRSSPAPLSASRRFSMEPPSGNLWNASFQELRLMAKFSEHLIVGSGFLNSARFPLPPNLNVDPSVIEGVSSCLHINIEIGEGDVPRISGGQTSSPAALLKVIQRKHSTHGRNISR